MHVCVCVCMYLCVYVHVSMGGRTARLVAAAALTAIGVIGHSDDAHRLLRDVHAQQLHVTAHVLVGPLHSPAHPVSPEDVLPVHSQPEGVDWL